MIEIIKTTAEMRVWSSRIKKEGKLIGFVPTMGYLHDGHLSLVRKAKEENEYCVVSIFVNPTQFAPNEDLAKYPRDFERDKQLLISAGADIIFYPDVSEIYPKTFQTYVSVEKVTSILEGEKRPAHFRGVTTIVSILFNAVKPDAAYFGQKDAQQAAVISRMNEDLKFGINIRILPVIRENDGLAMSSRNIYLSGQEREEALVLFKSLKTAENLISEGERNCSEIIKKMEKLLRGAPSSNPDYAAIVEKTTFEKAEYLEEGTSYYILVACKIGNTRLIDNILITL